MQGLFRNHLRIWIGVALGIGVFFSLPAEWLLVTRVLVAWDCGVTSFLVLLWVWMSRLTAQEICSRYFEEDASGPVILVDEDHRPRGIFLDLPGADLLRR